MNTASYKILKIDNIDDNYKNKIVEYLYGLFSSDFIFDQDRFDIDKKDEVLHINKKILLSMKEFQSCINDIYLCKKDSCLDEYNLKMLVINSLIAFVIGRRTTLDKMDVEIKREDIKLHPTPYEVVYELFMHLNESFYNYVCTKEDYKAVTKLLQTYSKDKNEAVIFLRWYSQDGFRIGSLAKALNNAGFNLFKYDKENKIITYIKYPTLQSFSK